MSSWGTCPRAPARRARPDPPPDARLSQTGHSRQDTCGTRIRLSLASGLRTLTPQRELLSNLDALPHTPLFRESCAEPRTLLVTAKFPAAENTVLPSLTLTIGSDGTRQGEKSAHPKCNG